MLNHGYVIAATACRGSASRSIGDKTAWPDLADLSQFGLAPKSFIAIGVLGTPDKIVTQRTKRPDIYSQCLSTSHRDQCCVREFCRDLQGLGACRRPGADPYDAVQPGHEYKSAGLLPKEFQLAYSCLLKGQVSCCRVACRTEKYASKN